MVTIDDLAIEIVNAKEQLKSVNNTINKDRKILSELEEKIKKKEEEIKGLENEIKERKDEVASLEKTKEKSEGEYGKIRDGLKNEINKLAETKKKDEEKYQIILDELQNDVKVLKNRKEELSLMLKNLEAEVKKVKMDRDNEIGNKEMEIKEVQEKLDGFHLLFDEQDAKYRKIAREMEDMNKKMEEKDELSAMCDKLERDIDKKNEKLAEIKEEIKEEEWRIVAIREDIDRLIGEREDLEKEMEWYIKKRLDLKERGDKLDAKEKYLRKRFEEAGIKFD